MSILHSPQVPYTVVASLVELFRSGAHGSSSRSGVGSQSASRATQWKTISSTPSKAFLDLSHDPRRFLARCLTFSKNFMIWKLSLWYVPVFCTGCTPEYALKFQAILSKAKERCSCTPLSLQLQSCFERRGWILRVC